MESRLIVKNFGPIKDVNIILKNVNIFIGPQASGKSTLAKIFTIFKAPRKFITHVHIDSFEDEFLNFEKEFSTILEDYNISSFLRDDTEISFDSALHSLAYKDGKFLYNPKIYRKIHFIERLGQDFNNKSKDLIDSIQSMAEKLLLFRIEVGFYLRNRYGLSNDKPLARIIDDLEEFWDVESYESILSLVKKTEQNLSENAALYIPAERNLINMILSSSMSLILANATIPRHLMSFGAEIQKSNQKKIDLGFLQKNLRYEQVDGQNFIIAGRTSKVRLDQAASGVQSVVPILIPIFSHKITSGHRSFVIEEPELNLFPSAQYELIKLLESSRQDYDYEDLGTIHTYTTHSPYILSTLNNLLYARKVKIKNYGSVDKVNKVNKITSNSEIDPEIFTAYQIKNGKAYSIFNSKLGLIKENFIDESSDVISDDFDNLMDLM
ncbi:MAG: AAA family ATPase [Taibaiella sp.]|jgi:hypothetical protein